MRYALVVKDVNGKASLNPYSIGRWSVSWFVEKSFQYKPVLILILLEDGQ